MAVGPQAVAQDPVRQQVAVVDLRIGKSTDPDYSLSRISTALISTTGGGVIVPQPTEGLLRFFDSAGRVIKQGARNGELATQGFKGLRAAGRLGDSVWVFDEDTRRVTLLSEQGRKLGSFALPDYPSQLLATNVLALLRGGGVLLRGVLSANGLLGSPRVAPLSIADLTSGEYRFSREIPTGTMVFVVRTDGVASMRSSRLAAMLDQEPLVAASPDGEFVVLIDRSTDGVSAVEASVRITVLTPQGHVAVSRRVMYVPMRVDREGIDRELDAMAASVMTVKPNAFVTQSAARSAIEKQIPVPPYYPPASAVMVGIDHSIWLRDAVGTREVGRIRGGSAPSLIVWRHYDQQGILIAVVRAPAEVILQTASGDVLWGIAEDELGFPIVLRLRVH